MVRTKKTQHQKNKFGVILQEGLPSSDLCLPFFLALQAKKRGEVFTVGFGFCGSCFFSAGGSGTSADPRNGQLGALFFIAHVISHGNHEKLLLI